MTDWQVAGLLKVQGRLHGLVEMVETLGLQIAELKQLILEGTTDKLRRSDKLLGRDVGLGRASSSRPYGCSGLGEALSFSQWSCDSRDRWQVRRGVHRQGEGRSS